MSKKKKSRKWDPHYWTEHGMWMMRGFTYRRVRVRFCERNGVPWVVMYSEGRRVWSCDEALFLKDFRVVKP
jgi:hypothetical protein